MMSHRPMPRLAALDRCDAETRDMTRDEIAVIRELSCGPYQLGSHKGLIRALHARSLTPNKHITPGEAAMLRAFVTLLKSTLDPAIVAMAGGN